MTVIFVDLRVDGDEWCQVRPRIATYRTQRLSRMAYAKAAPKDGRVGTSLNWVSAPFRALYFDPAFDAETGVEKAPQSRGGRTCARSAQAVGRVHDWQRPNARFRLFSAWRRPS